VIKIINIGFLRKGETNVKTLNIMAKLMVGF
jgi:hypothetical protein